MPQELLQTDHTATILIRQVLDSDVDAYLSFLLEQEKRHESVGKVFPLPVPTNAETMVACDQGSLYLATTASRDDRGGTRVVGCAGAFEIDTRHIDNRKIFIVDLGGMAVDVSVAGLAPHSLQDILMWMLTIGQFVQQPPNKDVGVAVLASALEQNVKSCEAINRCHFERVASAPSWLEQLTATWSGDKPVSHAILTRVALKRLILNFLQLYGNPRARLSRVNKETNAQEAFEIRFEIDWLTNYLSVVTRMYHDDAFMDVSPLPR